MNARRDNKDIYNTNAAWKREIVVDNMGKNQEKQVKVLRQYLII